jgi:glycosyltransferase involved in cell wall biosynthesis
MTVLAWPAFKTRYKNPYNWLLYTQIENLGISVKEFTPERLLMEFHEVIHLHWPVETIVRHPSWAIACARAIIMLVLLQIAHWRGCTILWTIHDEQPHVLLHPRLAEWFERELVHLVDGTIHICEASATRVRQSLPALAQCPAVVIPHGHYQEVYPNRISPLRARQEMGLAPHQRVLLFLGNISPYKNVPHLVQTFRELPAADLALVIAGNPDNNALSQAIEQAADGDPRVHLHLRFIPDEALQIFFNAADLVVLPFQTILNSGSTLLALSFNCPVLAPHLGALPEWQRRFGQRWVRTYDGPFTQEALHHGLANPPLPVAGEEAPLESLDWATLARQTVEFYRQFKTL